MANDLNRCEFIGRLGDNVETRFMPSGGAVANFSIAVGKQWKDKQSGEKKESTQWIRIVAFNNLAEICGKYLTKGSRIFIAGEFRERKWQDQQGQDRYTTEIVADQMQMLDSRVSDGASSSNGQQRQQQGGGYAPPMPDDSFEDDIPF